MPICLPISVPAGSHQNVFTTKLVEGLALSQQHTKILTLEEFPTGERPVFSVGCGCSGCAVLGRFYATVPGKGVLSQLLVVRPYPVIVLTCMSATTAPPVQVSCTTTTGPT
jgi:hypothetical protein